MINILRRLLLQPFYRLYEGRLTQVARGWNLPQHIGIILDGNRRFARHQGLANVIDGHELGANKLREVFTWCHEFGIPVITVWVFSTDNFSRDEEEVQGLFKLIETKTRELKDNEDVHRYQLRIRFIGQLTLLPEGLQEAIREAEAATEQYSQLTLNVAIAYGGREEITDACRCYLQKQLAEGKSIDTLLDGLQPEVIDDYLYTSGQPEPDLIIRTSGEVRMSGFMLWQSAYSELYFCDTFWPAFRKIDFARALRSYHQRKRRYGK